MSAPTKIDPIKHIGRCWTCQRKRCVFPRVLKLHPEQGCCKWQGFWRVRIGKAKPEIFKLKRRPGL